MYENRVNVGIETEAGTPIRGKSSWGGNFEKCAGGDGTSEKRIRGMGRQNRWRGCTRYAKKTAGRLKDLHPWVPRNKKKKDTFRNGKVGGVGLRIKVPPNLGGGGRELAARGQVEGEGRCLGRSSSWRAGVPAALKNLNILEIKRESTWVGCGRKGLLGNSPDS